MVGWLLLACAEPAAESADGGEEPLCTWDNWGAGYFGSYCLSCHSTGTPDRRGAPTRVDFDAESQVRSFATALLWGGAYGDPSSEGPLATPFSGGVKVDGTCRADGGLGGVLAGAMSTDDAALDVRSLTVDDGRLTGSLATRDPRSGWRVVELPEDGSGCGPAHLRRQELRRVLPRPRRAVRPQQ